MLSEILFRRRRWAVVGVSSVMAFAFGASAQLTLADHWHTFQGVSHGVTHGSDTRDASFFGRTDSPYLGWNECAVGDTGVGWYASTTTTNANLCSLWSHAVWGSPDECRAAAYSRQYTQPGVGGHVHYAHNYDGSSCRKYFT